MDDYEDADEPQTPLPKVSLRSRQQMLYDRIKTIQAILPDKILKTEGDKANPGKKLCFEDASESITKHHSKLKVSDIVSQYQAKKRAENAMSSTKGQRIAHDGDISNSESSICGTIPLDEWYKIIQENK